MILLDEEIVDLYCKSICPSPQYQCPLCSLRKLHDATAFKYKDKLTNDEALKKVEDKSQTTFCLIKNKYDYYDTNGCLPKINKKGEAHAKIKQRTSAGIK